MDYETKKARKLAIIIGGVFLCIIIGLVLFFIYSTTKSKYGDELDIANLDSYTSGKPINKEKLDYIKYELFRVVNKNSKKPIKSESVKDILVRDKSFSQTFNEGIKTHTVAFIVDIKSLKQSYDVSYQWVDDSAKSQDTLDEYGTVIKCLPEEKLLYGAFNCKDMFTELATPSDPILNHLPYSTPNIEVVYDARSAKTLSVTIKTSAVDERTNGDAAIEAYKIEAKTWLASVVKNPDEYTVNYLLVRASLY